MTAETEPQPRVISNSEVSNWNSCKAKYRYYHDLKLEPVHKSDSLSLGITLHNCLENYYRAILQGKTRQEALEASFYVIQQTMLKDAVIAQRAYLMLEGYFAVYADEASGWKILAVEQDYRIPLTSDYTYVMKLDLLVQDLSDLKIKIVDHKSTYDFWSEDDFALNMQFPKYIGALRFNNIKVDEIIVNQLRTRSLKAPKTEDLFRRTPLKYADFTIRQALQEQIVASQQIAAYRALPEPQRKQQATRIANRMMCRMCGVKALCIGEFNGANIDYLISSEFQRNTYDEGYNPSKVSEQE